jgi:hypothetical protein
MELRRGYWQLSCRRLQWLPCWPPSFVVDCLAAVGCSQVLSSRRAHASTVARLSAAVVPTPVMAPCWSPAMLTPLAAGWLFSVAVVPTPVMGRSQVQPIACNGCCQVSAAIVLTPARLPLKRRTKNAQRHRQLSCHGRR